MPRVRDELEKYRDHECNWKWVYVFKDDSGLIKIGMTFNVHQRVMTIMKSTGHSIEIVAARKMPNASTIERALHLRYCAYQTYGEWFRLSEQQINELCEELGNDECLNGMGTIPVSCR